MSHHPIRPLGRGFSVESFRRLTAAVPARYWKVGVVALACIVAAGAAWRNRGFLISLWTGRGDRFVPCKPGPLSKGEQKKAIPAPLPVGNATPATGSTEALKKEFEQLVKEYNCSCLANEGDGHSGQCKVDEVYQKLTKFASEHSGFILPPLHRVNPAKSVVPTSSSTPSTSSTATVPASGTAASSTPSRAPAMSSTAATTPTLEQIWEIYKNADYTPKKNRENLETYVKSEDYQRHAKTARIYYNASQLAEADALRVIFQREPSNMDAEPKCNEGNLKQLFGYTSSAYNDTELKKEDGSSFKDLPNSAAVYSETYLWNPLGGQKKKEIACLSLPAPALDSKKQAHYGYYTQDDRLIPEKYEEEMAFLFKLVEQVVRDHVKTAFGGRGIKRLVLSRFGQANFLKSLEYGDQEEAHDIFKKHMKQLGSNIEDLKLPSVLSEWSGIDGWHDHVMEGNICEVCQEGDLIINPWDPHSAPGNGNENDRSFDGVIGRSTSILLTQSSWLNGNLKDKKSLVAVFATSRTTPVAPSTTAASSTPSSPASATNSTSPGGKSYSWIKAGDEMSLSPQELMKTCSLPTKVGGIVERKKYAYERAMSKSEKYKYQGEISYSKWGLGNTPNVLWNRKFFVADSKTKVTVIQGPQATFPFDSSTDEVAYWTANFADGAIFGFLPQGRLAQEEVIGIEHPHCFLLKDKFEQLDKTQGEAVCRYQKIDEGEAVLLQNVPRQAKLDTSKKISHAGTIYGGNFNHEKTTDTDINDCLEVFDTPTYSNIFSIVAPNIGNRVQGTPYTKDELKKILQTLCVAFHGIKEKSKGKRVVIDTGNWGCGAFGNGPKLIYIMQLAVVKFVKVDEIRFYPRENRQALEDAQTLFNQIEKAYSNMTTTEFLTHLAGYAQDYGLVWGQSNKT